MLTRRTVLVTLFGSLLAATLHAQPSGVKLAFYQQGPDCRLVLGPKSLTVDLDSFQEGLVYWGVGYYCTQDKSLHIDEDFIAQQPCSFCALDLELKGTSGEQPTGPPNVIPAWANGEFGYRVRLCDPRSQNNCVQHDPEVEVRRPRGFDDSVRVVLTEHAGRCTADSPGNVRRAESYAVVTWLVLNGCSERVRAQARPKGGAEGDAACSHPIDVPPGKTGRLACPLPALSGTQTGAEGETTVRFALILDKPVAKTALELAVTVKR